MRAWFRWCFIAGVVFASACASVRTTEPGAVGVERKQYMLVSEAQVEEAAAIAYRQELEKARAAGVLNANAALLQRVRTISDRLIPKTGVFRSDAPQWQWEVNVQTRQELNAYCMPGGKIMVYSGIVETLKLTDAELAAVIGHEMAHALREHGRERVSRAYAEQLALWGLATAVGLGQRAQELAGMVADVTFTLPHSREQESEADLVGLELIARGGYDPRAAPELWRKMERGSQGRTPELLSTHPASEKRLKELEDNVPKVLPLFEKPS